MHKYEAMVLKALRAKNHMGFDELVSASGLGRDEALWALESLKQSGMVDIEYGEEELIDISDEGKEYVKDGLAEEQLLRRMLKENIKAAGLQDQKSRIGLQWAKAGGFIHIDAGELKLTEAGKKAAEEGVPEGMLLRRLAKGDYDSKALAQLGQQMHNLSKRKLVAVHSERYINRIGITKKGLDAPEYSDVVEQVDRGVIAGETWKGKEFKRYDVNVGVEGRIPAMRSPIKRIIDQVKDAYVSMGFQEVSGPAIETSFWNFDSLFVPQDHPAREMQDTFYLSKPESAEVESREFVKKIKRAHEKGWHSKWSEDTARQLVLRTHMTSVSARFVYKVIDNIANNREQYSLPVKLFSVGRVFRNEAIDYKHLADLYQMDGIIIGKGLTMANLFDTLTRVYDYMGVEVRFKPSYFPFVEPGAEYQARLKGRDEWIEMGGGGIIREEITGVRRNRLTVLAWGAGVERILLVKDPSLASISELYNNGIGWLRKRRLV